MDTDGWILYVNRAECDFLQYAHVELMSEKIIDVAQNLQEAKGKNPAEEVKVASHSTLRWCVNVKMARSCHWKSKCQAWQLKTTNSLFFWPEFQIISKEEADREHLAELGKQPPGGMDGKATMKELAEFDPDVKAILSSGYLDDIDTADLKHFGFREIIAKPARPTN